MSDTDIDSYEEELLREGYRRMVRIREFERAYFAGVEKGTVPRGSPAYIGQEAVAVGACLALRDDDIIGATYRGNGPMIGKGSDVTPLLKELGGRESGLNHGRSGPMHRVDLSSGVFPLNGIVGEGLPHVVGGVLSSQMDGDDRIGLVFFGDGATNHGVVPETLNLAAIWEVPVVFVCVNNGYAVTTPIEKTTATETLAERADGYGVPATKIDGQDFLTVYDTVSTAVEDARNDRRPRFVECETYRFEDTPNILADIPYRPEEEVERWRRRDPIALLGERLVESETLPESELESIEEAVASEIAEAVEAMESSEFPSAARALEETYADQDYPNTPAPKYR